MNQKDYSNDCKAALKIQSWFRGCLARNSIRLLMSQLFKRQKIIEELLYTQKNYINDLHIIVKDFKQGLLIKKIINLNEAKIIFSNLDQIIKLNEHLYQIISQEALPYSHYKIIFQKVKHEIYFFKIYFQYFNNFTIAMKKVDDLTQSNSQFQKFTLQIRTNQKYKLLTLKDYLIKPIQRLPKYVLILKEIKKRTEPIHLDYNNIVKVLTMFEEVNYSNNQKLSRVVASYKISQIEKNLKLPHSISEPGIQFILEEPVTILNMDSKTYECIMYLLNTQIIISKRLNQQEKFMTSIPFKNGGGNIVQNEDQYFYKHSFTVENNEGDSCTFLCNNEDDKNLLIQKIYNQIVKASQRNYQKIALICGQQKQGQDQYIKKMNRLDLLPEVQVLGTDQRSDSMFKYTIYIIQVRIKNIKLKIFVRFNEIFQLQVNIKLLFPQIKIKNQLFKTAWLLNHTPKMIEERKMIIQRFLKEILCKRQIIQNGAPILTKIGLPPDFYSLPNRYKQTDQNLKRSTLSHRSTGSQNQIQVKKSAGRLNNCISIIHTIYEQYENEPQPQQQVFADHYKKVSIQQILQANQINLGHYSRFNQSFSKYNQSGQQLTIAVYIPWLENEKGIIKVELKMKKTQRVLCLINQLSAEIELRYYKDFRLYLERQYAGRQLDDDEYLPKVIQQKRYGNYRLIFKKMIYVDNQIEDREMKNDRVRLKIIAAQVIYEIKKDKYILTYNSLLILSVLVGIAQTYKQKQCSELCLKQKYEELQNKLSFKTRELLINKYTAFYDSTGTWEKDYDKMYRKVIQKIIKISQSNAIVYRRSNMNNAETQFNITNISQLAAYSIVSQIKKNDLFGSVSYIVQISENFRKLIEAQQEKNQKNMDNRNCWLIVKYNIICLYTISLKKCIFSCRYDEVIKLQPYPASIILHFRGRELDFLKMKTSSSYCLRQLLYYYKNYNQMIQKMRIDPSFQDSIIELVKQQNRQSNLEKVQQIMI